MRAAIQKWALKHFWSSANDLPSKCIHGRVKQTSNGIVFGINLFLETHSTRLIPLDTTQYEHMTPTALIYR